MIHWHSIHNKDGSVDRYAIAGAVNGVDQYTVAKVVVFGGTQYEAWHKSHRLGAAVSAEVARKLCEGHASETRPLSHRHDPDTSRQAAALVDATGTRDDHITIIVSAVRRHPGHTSAELAQITGLERHEAARRTADAEHRGLIRKGPARKCSLSHRAAVTWQIALTESQRECLRGAA